MGVWGEREDLTVGREDGEGGVWGTLTRSFQFIGDGNPLWTLT